MDIMLKTRRKHNVVTFWGKIQDEEIKNYFPLVLNL